MKNHNIKEIQEALKDFIDIHKNEEPVYRGCLAASIEGGGCNCTGLCKEIIGWKPKTKETFWNEILR